MAHIPYGYRIERGKAQPDPEKAEKLNKAINGYLSGLSIKEANKAAGGTLSDTALRHYLKSGVYAGTDYYPPIVPEGTFDRVMAEMAERTHDGFSIRPAQLPIKTCFRIEPGQGRMAGEARTAGEIYSLIRAAPDGHSVITDWERRSILQEIRDVG